MTARVYLVCRPPYHSVVAECTLEQKRSFPSDSLTPTVRAIPRHSYTWNSLDLSSDDLAVDRVDLGIGVSGSHLLKEFIECDVLR